MTVTSQQQQPMATAPPYHVVNGHSQSQSPKYWQQTSCTDSDVIVGWITSSSLTSSAVDHTSTCWCLRRSCLSVRLSQHSYNYLRNHVTELHHIFCARWQLPRLDPPLPALRYVMYFRFSRRRSFSHTMQGPMARRVHSSASIPSTKQFCSAMKTAASRPILIVAGS